ncbi:hypothetical protein CYY_003706 [Polysphondylium violaceum]|uniref:non-specific serine/threonine protein kinase n=1 Tax=Polysphondylium violaceum TaxID=133409 RepID=A0A8J4PWE8_9MYCE|nr:hypothetical protein CYY_003706 [Polysphondylium violaceum]
MNKLFEISNNFIEAAGKQLNNLNISEKTKSISDSVIGNFTGKGGQIYDINGKRYTEVRLIAEGGFGFVYQVRDDYNQNFALKKMVISERERVEAMKNEVSFMKKLRNNQNVVKIEGFKLIENPHRRDTEVYLLMELCTGGSLLDIMNAREATRLDEREILSVFSDVCYAIQEMHSQTPPISHRDLKIENILFCENTNRYKLCDFGSATTKTFNTARERERALAEDDINMFTTLFYRAPEMVDLYRQSIINEKVDIWALGCLLFKMAFYVDPFEGGSLQILNNGYKIPEHSKYSSNLHSLIHFILVPDPNERPSINDVINKLQEIRGRKGLNTYGNNSPTSSTLNYQQQSSNNFYSNANNNGRSTPTTTTATPSSSSLSSSNSTTPLYSSHTPNNNTSTPPPSNRSTPNSTPPSTRRLFDILDGPGSNSNNNNNYSPNSSMNNFKPQPQTQQQPLKNSSSSTSSPSILDDFDSWGNSPITTTTSAPAPVPIQTNIKSSANNINNSNNNNNNNNNAFTFDNDNDFDFGSFVSSTSATTNNTNNNFNNNRMNNSYNNMNMNNSGNNIINPAPAYNPNFIKPQVSNNNNNNNNQSFDFFSTPSPTASSSNLSHSTSSTSSSTSGFDDILKPMSKQTLNNSSGNLSNSSNNNPMYNNNMNNNNNNYPKPNYSVNMNTINSNNTNNSTTTTNGNGNSNSNSNNYNGAFSNLF